ncbi:MAG: high-potential iron-sulfur protein [Bdellovibrio sp.]|nr:high-potential iron-sulfur protein [Bdellovibrio sp.]
MNRRSFFQASLFAIGAATVLPSILQAEERRRGGSAAGAAATLVDPKDAAAKAVNYVHLNTEIKDKALRTDRNGVKFEAQHCKSCAFYDASKETTVAGKKAGGCQMPFAAGKLVAAEGWCTTWAKKA